MSVYHGEAAARIVLDHLIALGLGVEFSQQEVIPLVKKMPDGLRGDISALRALAFDTVQEVMRRQYMKFLRWEVALAASGPRNFCARVDEALGIRQ